MDLRSAQRNAIAHLRRFHQVKAKHVLNSRQRPFSSEWLVGVDVLGSEVDITLKLPWDFPLTLPEISAPPDVVRQLGFPANVNARGSVCTFDPVTTTPDPESPGDLLKACVDRAVHILERDPTTSEQLYDNEFLAYWEERYPPEPPVDARIISLISEEGPPGEELSLVRFGEPLGRFHSAIYSRASEFDPLRSTLEAKRIRFEEERIFHVGDLTSLRPPFNLRNVDVLRLIQSLGLHSEFLRYVATGPRRATVTFTCVVGDRHLVLGWRHKASTPAPSGKYHKRRSKRQVAPHLFSQRDRFESVERLSPQGFTSQRLDRRASAEYVDVVPQDNLKILVAGLGSVGSQLTAMLAGIQWTAFHLVDHDVLAVENLRRHHLGLSWVGMPKVNGMEQFLIDKNPLGDVAVRRESLVAVATREPGFINACDYLFVCVGQANIESWTVEAQQDGRISRPILLLWVEPYLAGGHCVLVNPGDGGKYFGLFDGPFYRHNVIGRETHDTMRLTKREGGCQTSYMPYGNEPLLMFLSALFPSLLTTMRERSIGSRRWTWVGDLDALRELGIEVTSDAEAIGTHGILSEELA